MKSKTIAYRATAESDEYLQSLANEEGVSKSTILRILVTGEGPPAVVERIRARHVVNELNRMALPTEGAIAAVNDRELMYAIGKLCSYTSAIMTCRYLGKETEAQNLENDRATAEAELYRIYGAAVKRNNS